MTIIRPPKNYGSNTPHTIRRLETWAQEHDVQLHKIAERKESREPDYRVVFSKPETTEIIVEVKEIVFPFQIISENGEPVIQIEETGKQGERFKSADRVRQKIKKGHSQLRPYAKRGFPTLLLIGNWTPVLDEDLAWQIPIAMYGGGPRFIIGNTGYEIVSVAQGGKQASGNINRSISGIARFEYFGENGRAVDSPQKMVMYRHNNPRIALPEHLPGVRFSNDTLDEQSDYQKITVTA